MTKAATTAALQDLHRMVAQSITARIKQDMEDDLPTDAATLGVAIKFLKDNNVSADPADKEDLTAMREALTKQVSERKKRGSNVIEMAQADLKQANGG
jgi:hypothetical protein